MSKALKMASVGFGGGPLAVEDVFATSLYNGDNSAQTITNGVDLAGEGGLVWTKARSTTFPHFLTDTLRGGNAQLSSNTTGAISTSSPAEITSFNSNGYTLAGNTVENTSGQTFVGWTFRKAPKFFDVVTYTGDGTASKNVSHTLGVKPGAMLIKSTSNTEAWGSFVLAANGNYHSVTLNSTAADPFGAPAVVPASTTTSSDFNVAELASYSASGQGNTSGQTYVAYLFAHDTDTVDGLIQCGSFATDGSGNATVTLGWEPQWVIIKPTNNTGDWLMFDTQRGWASGNDALLKANTADAESAVSEFGAPNGTGFSVQSLSSSISFVYIAIRKP